MHRMTNRPDRQPARPLNSVCVQLAALICITTAISSATEPASIRPATDNRPLHRGEPAIIDLGRGERLEFIWIANLWVSRFETTNGQYKRFRPLRGKARRLNERHRPVVYVSWYDAMHYCRRLDDQYGKLLPKTYHFRLPTGPEWEQMALCGDDRTYPWGNTSIPLFGNYGAITGYNENAEFTCPVEHSGTNDWGLYGLGGNVWEWCYNSYKRSKHHRMLRGASWQDSAKPFLEVRFKNGSPPRNRFSNVGFRVVIGLGK